MPWDGLELSHWEDVSRRVFVPFHNGVISQFEGYEGLAELDWQAYRQRYGNIEVSTASLRPRTMTSTTIKLPSRPTH